MLSLYVVVYCRVLSCIVDASTGAAGRRVSVLFDRARGRILGEALQAWRDSRHIVLWVGARVKRAAGAQGGW